MKYCRFQIDDDTHYGLVESVAGRDMITRILTLADDAEPLEEAQSRRMAPLRLDEARLLAPVAPSKIVCVGRNYREHAKELGNEVPAELLIFLKPPSSVIGPGAEIRRPGISKRVDHEGEL